MQRKYSFIIMLLHFYTNSFTTLIRSKPSCTVYTPNSILEHKEQYTILPVGDRTRYSTCTGAAWFHNNYLAVLNLHGRNIRTYKFDSITKNFEFFQEIQNQNECIPHHPENLAVSPNGKLLAICSDHCNPGVDLYRIDLETHLISPQPILHLAEQDLVHNVKFSSDGKYLAYATFHNDTSISIYEVIDNNITLHLKHMSRTPNNFTLVKAKGVAFTKNDRFILVSYCLNVLDSTILPLRNLLISYPFNKSNGTLGAPISQVTQKLSVEDICFINNDNHILVTNQADDTIVVYSFDQTTGFISDGHILLQNPEAELSFPHGLAVSPDGNYLVVTNYGDDKFNLYEIKN